MIAIRVHVLVQLLANIHKRKLIPITDLILFLDIENNKISHDHHIRKILSLQLPYCIQYSFELLQLPIEFHAILDETGDDLEIWDAENHYSH